MSLATAEAVYFARCGGRGSSTQRPIWPRINAPGEEIQAANLPRASAQRGPLRRSLPFRPRVRIPEHSATGSGWSQHGWL